MTDSVYFKCISLVPDDLVSEEMEEDDIISELPCTLAIEDSTQNSAEPKKTDQVRLKVSVWYASYQFVTWLASCFSILQPPMKQVIEHLHLFSLQFQFKEIILTEEEKRLLSKEGATIPTHMPLTKVIDAEKCFFTWADSLVTMLSGAVSCSG